MAITRETLDELLAGVSTQEDLFGQDGLLKELTRRLLERMLEGELTTHLGYERYAIEGRGSGNSRNGYSPKTVKTEQGELELEIPRDRAGTFEPVIVPKGETRLAGLDEKIVAL